MQKGKRKRKAVDVWCCLKKKINFSFSLMNRANKLYLMSLAERHLSLSHSPEKVEMEGLKRR